MVGVSTGRRWGPSVFGRSRCPQVVSGCRWRGRQLLVGGCLVGGRLCRVGPQWGGAPRSASLPCAAPVHAGASFVRPARLLPAVLLLPASFRAPLSCAAPVHAGAPLARPAPPPPGALSLPAPFRTPLPCAAPAHARRTFRAASFLPPGPFSLAGVCAVPDRNGAGAPLRLPRRTVFCQNNTLRQTLSPRCIHSLPIFCQFGRACRLVQPLFRKGA